MKKQLVLATMLMATSTFASVWNEANNPDAFSKIVNGPMDRKLVNLPLSGKLKDDRLGWSETYWPSKLGGIAYRWNSSGTRAFKYKKFSKAQLLTMSEQQLSELSPAELYDISQGDYSYTLTKKVLRKYNKRDLWWEGICHGWARAATHYPEPNKVVVVNPDGIKVPFGASDVKGLLSMHDAFNKNGGVYAKIGARCNVRGKVAGEELPSDEVTAFPVEGLANRPDCTDVNPGAFHIVLSNMIGVYSRGVVVDIDRFADVWNQPVVGYDSVATGEQAPTASELSKGIAKKIRFVTNMHYGDELEFRTRSSEAEGNIHFVSKEPVTGTPMQLTSTRRYEYVVELNAAGEIMGGTWISDSRPDFLWIRTQSPKFYDGKFPLAGLNTIYKPVVR